MSKKESLLAGFNIPMVKEVGNHAGKSLPGFDRGDIR
jgi:hypothetical protein